MRFYINLCIEKKLNILQILLDKLCNRCFISIFLFLYKVLLIPNQMFI